MTLFVIYYKFDAFSRGWRLHESEIQVQGNLSRRFAALSREEKSRKTSETRIISCSLDRVGWEFGGWGEGVMEARGERHIKPW